MKSWEELTEEDITIIEDALRRCELSLAEASAALVELRAWEMTRLFDCSEMNNRRMP